MFDSAQPCKCQTTLWVYFQLPSWLVIPFLVLEILGSSNAQSVVWLIPNDDPQHEYCVIQGLLTKILNRVWQTCAFCSVVVIVNLNFAAPVFIQIRYKDYLNCSISHWQYVLPNLVNIFFVEGGLCLWKLTMTSLQFSVMFCCSWNANMNHSKCVEWIVVSLP